MMKPGEVLCLLTHFRGPASLTQQFSPLLLFRKRENHSARRIDKMTVDLARL